MEVENGLVKVDGGATQLLLDAFQSGTQDGFECNPKILRESFVER